MDGGEFYELAKMGRLYIATGKPASKKIGTGETPFSLGEREDYSYEDIAHWYIARRVKINEKKNWVKKSTKYGWLAENMGQVEIAREEFIKDAITEGKLSLTKAIRIHKDDYPNIEDWPETKNMTKDERKETVSKVNIEKVKKLVIEALYTDGGHHKQWYIEKIGKVLRIDLKSEYKKVEWEQGKAP